MGAAKAHDSAVGCNAVSAGDVVPAAGYAIATGVYERVYMSGYITELV